MQKLHNTGFGNDLLGKMAEAIKSKKANWPYFMKILEICASDTIIRVQRQPTQWKKKICELYI